MAVAVVQSTNTGDFTSTKPYTLTLNGVGATSILVIGHCPNTASSGDISSITDSGGSNGFTWSKVITTNGTSTAAEQWVGVPKAGWAGGNITVTVNWSTATATGGFLYELSEANLTTPVQPSGGTGGNTGTTSAPASATLTPSSAGCLMLVAEVNNQGAGSSVPPSSPWVSTILTSKYEGATYQSGLTSGTAYTATWTGSTENQWTTAAALYQPAASAVAGTAAFTATLTGSAVGAVGLVGTAAQTISLSGAAVGAVGIPATATQTISLTGAAVGQVGIAATAVGAIALTGLAVGVVKVTAITAQVISLTGAAIMTVAVAGTASFTAALTGTAAGAVGVSASAAASMSLIGTAVGTWGFPGAASFTAALTGTAVGTWVRTTVTIGRQSMKLGAQPALWRQGQTLGLTVQPTLQ